MTDIVIAFTSSTPPTPGTDMTTIAKYRAERRRRTSTPAHPALLELPIDDEFVAELEAELYGRAA
jgi:hypothetical protein